MGSIDEAKKLLETGPAIKASYLKPELYPLVWLCRFAGSFRKPKD